MKFFRYCALMAQIQDTAKDCERRIIVAKFELRRGQNAVRKTKKILAQVA